MLWHQEVSARGEQADVRGSRAVPAMQESPRCVAVPLLLKK